MMHKRQNEYAISVTEERKTARPAKEEGAKCRHASARWRQAYGR